MVAVAVQTVLALGAMPQPRKYWPKQGMLTSLEITAKIDFAALEYEPIFVGLGWSTVSAQSGIINAVLGLNFALTVLTVLTLLLCGALRVIQHCARSLALACRGSCRWNGWTSAKHASASAFWRAPETAAGSCTSTSAPTLPTTHLEDRRTRAVHRSSPHEPHFRKLLPDGLAGSVRSPVLRSGQC
jgi:hypothetical protein